MLVEINSETDFVAKSPNFVALADRVLAAAVDSPARDADALLATEVDGSSVQTIVDETAATLASAWSASPGPRGRRARRGLPAQGQQGPAPAGRRAGRHRRGGCRRGPDIATHIAAFSPTYLTREDVSADIVANERHIAEETARNEGKPEAALPRSSRAA